MKKGLIYLASGLFLIGIWFSVPQLSAQAEDYGLNDTAKQITAYSDQVKQGDDYYQNFLQTKTGQIIGAVLSFIGVIFLVLMIYAGVTWMTAQGNEQQVTKAKDLIINSIIGIIIVFAAYAITTFVGAQILQ